jgi:hypothetical protein
MIISINSFERSEEDHKCYYRVNVQYQDWKTTVMKRYSEFLELHQVMKIIRNNTGKSLPKFPTKMRLKTIFGLMSEKSLEHRRQCLDIYMSSLASEDFALRSKYFLDFVNLPVRYRSE